MRAFLACFSGDKNTYLTVFSIDKNDSGKQIQRKIFFKSQFFEDNNNFRCVCDFFSVLLMNNSLIQEGR